LTHGDAVSRDRVKYTWLSEPSDARTIIRFHETLGLTTYDVISTGKLPKFRRRLLLSSSGFKYPVATYFSVAWEKNCLHVVYYSKEILNE
jgi:hypothetical protein